MRKSKLLMPLTGIAALAATTPAIMATTSCNSKTVMPYTRIEATSTVTTNFVGARISKQDIHVLGYDSSGNYEPIYNWTCDEIGSQGYVFTSEGNKTFTIKYGTLSTQITFHLTKAANVFTDIESVHLFASGTVSSLQEFQIFAYTPSGVATEIDHSQFDFVQAGDCCAYNSTYKAVQATKAGSGTLKINFKGTQTQACQFAVVVEDTDNYISGAKVSSGGSGASVTLNKGSSLSAMKNWCIIPNYVKIQNQVFPVKEIGGATAATINTINGLIIPKTVNKIADELFAGSTAKLEQAIFLGTSSQFKKITATPGWEGKFLSDVYCDGDDRSVRLTNHVGSIFHTWSKVGGVLALTADQEMGESSAHTYYVKLDYSKITTTTGPEKYTTIDIYNDSITRFNAMHVNAVYHNNTLLTENTDYTKDDHGGHRNITITLKSSVTLDAESTILIELQTPRRSSGNISLGAHVVQ